MKSVIFALGAASLYGLGSVILGQYFSSAKFHGLTIIVAHFPVILVLAIICKQLALAHSGDPSFNLPNDWATWKIFIILGVIAFLANYFYCEAYASGGDVIVMTSLMVLVPVAAAVFRTFWVREMPNMCQIFGYVFAVIAVLFIAKGAKAG